jgi:MFS family permease
VINQLPDEPQEAPKKKTPDGKIILDPQPEDSANDPLNWPAWQRDIALLSLGLFCMVGGGTTPLLAAGFTDVADEYGVDVHDVSLTTGLYMLGMGLGSVIFSPTAILYGKRPVYLFGAVLYMATSIWCAVSPNFTSLVLARIFQGIAVSPVECLPSATIAEIFFLHERAFRIGIYTLLLLGGKNLVPLVSAGIIQSMGWRWVFWYVPLASSDGQASSNCVLGLSLLWSPFAAFSCSSSSLRPSGTAPLNPVSSKSRGRGRVSSGASRLGRMSCMPHQSRPPGHHSNGPSMPRPRHLPRAHARKASTLPLPGTRK